MSAVDLIVYIYKPSAPTYEIVTTIERPVRPRSVDSRRVAHRVYPSLEAEKTEGSKIREKRVVIPVKRTRSADNSPRKSDEEGS